MKYIEPEMEVVEFETVVITLTSLGVDNGEVPVIPGGSEF